MNASTPSRVVCVTESVPPWVAPFHFRLEYDGQAAIGTDSFYRAGGNYPFFSQVFAGGGCPVSEAGDQLLKKCGTQGGYSLTLRGQNFARPMRVLVGGNDCPVTAMPNTSYMECRMPQA